MHINSSIRQTALMCALTLALILQSSLFAASKTSGGSVWGADYFPNYELTSHEGEKVKFFDDLIKDKVVAINFIYTTCPDVCPLETARMKEVYQLLDGRVGKDVFLYSITIDPEIDTPKVLSDYMKKFKVPANWKFLTGKKEDIINIRKKLGVYIEDIQSIDSKNHNLSLVIGNQKTGRWMKRSPFENPYILASQIGGELHNWKDSRKNNRVYQEAPKLRNISKGESLFRTRCASCHTVGEGEIAAEHAIGPDLYNVTQRRDRMWLTRWIAEPDKMIAEKDPIALSMLAQYNNLAMPNMGLNSYEIERLLAYIEKESRALQKSALANPSAVASRPTKKIDHSKHMNHESQMDHGNHKEHGEHTTSK